MRIDCHFPITLRIAGAPTDDQLAAIGAALSRALAARLAEAERLLADRHGRHGAEAVEIRESYDPAREGAEGYAVASYGHGGPPAARPQPRERVRPGGDGRRNAIPSYGDEGRKVSVPVAGRPAPVPTKATAAQPADDDLFGDLRRVAAGAGEALDVLLGKRLTSEEMYHLLLLRRAVPLSIPASVVNEASTRIARLDERIAALDKALKQVGKDLAAARSARDGTKGAVRAAGAERLRQLQQQATELASQRRQSQAERVRLKRGRSLGVPGRGAPAGTGQITYVVIQVVDAQGRRIALEAAETTATEHAEERVLTRLRARFKPGELAGARMTVVGDQKVCAGRCRPALAKFAWEYGVELVESRYFVRPRADGSGDASPRTTVRTATEASSTGVIPAERHEEIYRRPGRAAQSTGSGTAGATTEPAAAPGRRLTPSGVETPRLPMRFRARAMAAEMGWNLIVDIVLDLLLAKFQQWRDERRLRERLESLQPKIDERKQQVFDALVRDPWRDNLDGWFYNVYLQIEAKTTTVIGGGRAVVIPGSPVPSVLNVEISRTARNEVLSRDDAVRVFSAAEGATGGVFQHSDVQVVVYSEPVRYE